MRRSREADGAWHRIPHLHRKNKGKNQGREENNRAWPLLHSELIKDTMIEREREVTIWLNEQLKMYLATKPA